MAEPAKNTANFNFSPNTISGQDYLTIKAEREEFQKKQLDANNEFMFQHYARLLRVLDVSYERATKANIVLERKERRAQAKSKRQALGVRAAR
jgi:uncharacterized phage-like protein YoqJ